MNPDYIAPEDERCGAAGHVAGSDYSCLCHADHTGYHAAEPSPGETVTWPKERNLMDTPRLPRPARVRIERDSDRRGARVRIDGVDVSNNVTSVVWSMEAGQLPHATLTFMDVEGDVQADTWNEPPAATEPNLDEYALYGSDTVDAMVTHTVIGCAWRQSFDDRPVTAMLKAIQQHHLEAHAGTSPAPTNAYGQPVSEPLYVKVIRPVEPVPVDNFVIPESMRTTMVEAAAASSWFVEPRKHVVNRDAPIEPAQPNQRDDGDMTATDSTDDEQYETHEWAVEWPTFLYGPERQTFATESEARERCPLYGPTAHVKKIEAVRVLVE